MSTSISNRLVGAASALACLLPATLFAAGWVASVDQQQGLPMLQNSGLEAFSSGFVFWGENWKWARTATEFSIAGPNTDYVVSGKNENLNLDLSLRVGKPSNHQLTWDIDLVAQRTAPNAIGGGVAYYLNVGQFRSQLGEPELLPDNRGWAWGKAGGTRLEMRFDPAPASVYFEQGGKGEIRVFFYSGQVPQGKRHYKATLALSDDIALRPTIDERFGLDKQDEWPTDVLNWNASPVDLSFLNEKEKPAGKHGFLRAVGENLVFEDGTAVRFWGTNLTASALFGTPRESVKQQARRLSELGFNLVRFHHHDSAWVDPNIFGSQKLPNTQKLSEEMLNRLDWWIKCLKDEGIYVWLDLTVGRKFKPGDDIDGFEEISAGKPSGELKGYNYVNASIQEAMKRFNEAYVNRKNAYTEVRYKDEPAIAAMLINNENDITSHFGNWLLPNKNVPKHAAWYMAAAASFAAKHGLPKDKTWRSWEPGPSKLFLNDLEQRFNSDMIANLRSEGVKVPIVTTSTWGTNPLSSLPALTVGDMIDVHAYGGTGELEKSPLTGPTLVDWLAAARVAGKPLTITEWNVERFPVPDRGTVPLYIAASAALQGWNALMQYAYAQVPLNTEGRPSNWHAFNDPALLATMPAAALLYRRGDVREWGRTIAFAPSTEQLFDQSISPSNSAALRTAVEKGRLIIALPQTKELPWLKKSPVPSGATVVTDPNLPLLPNNATEATSDSGEVRRNWDSGTLTINTALSQAAMGWIGGRKVSLADVDISALTRNATVAVQSLTDNPIRNSTKILISLGARSVPMVGDHMPFHSEPVRGQISVRAPAGLKLYAQVRSAEVSPYKYSKGGMAPQEREVPVSFKDGRYLINLERDWGTYWLLLKQ